MTAMRRRRRRHADRRGRLCRHPEIPLRNEVRRRAAFFLTTIVAGGGGTDGADEAFHKNIRRHPLKTERLLRASDMDYFSGTRNPLFCVQKWESRIYGLSNPDQAFACS